MGVTSRPQFINPLLSKEFRFNDGKAVLNLGHTLEGRLVNHALARKHDRSMTVPYVSEFKASVSPGRVVRRRCGEGTHFSTNGWTSKLWKPV